jgi:hypothetical protein
MKRKAVTAQIAPSDVAALIKALEALCNWIDSDPNAYDGDDDGSLGRLMYAARAALAKVRK